MTVYRYLTVTEWKGRWARPPVAEKLLDGEVAVHHVGGGAWMGGSVPPGEAASRAAACQVFYDLNLYAINVKGYSFLDYDVLVWYDRFNDICWIGDGRGQYMSAATKDRNEQSEAVCLCGNTHVRYPMAAELEGLARAIVQGVNKGWISRSHVIHPHRDHPAHPGATACPGQYLIPKLPIVRSRVAALLNPTPPPQEDPDVNWNPTSTTVAAVRDAPATVDVLAGKVNDWAVIALIKAFQEKAGLPVTGKWDQALGLAVDQTLEP